jgi:hypothetical protein
VPHGGSRKGAGRPSSVPEIDRDDIGPECEARHQAEAAESFLASYRRAEQRFDQAWARRHAVWWRYAATGEQFIERQWEAAEKFEAKWNRLP